MNNAGYKTYLQWKNSRSGTAYIQYNDTKKILQATESSLPPTNPFVVQHQMKTNPNPNQKGQKQIFFVKNFRKCSL